jgi:hypothetical protein
MQQAQHERKRAWTLQVQCLDQLAALLLLMRLQRALPLAERSLHSQQNNACATDEAPSEPLRRLYNESRVDQAVGLRHPRSNGNAAAPAVHVKQAHIRRQHTNN